jgi:hypothetical protein
MCFQSESAKGSQQNAICTRAELFCSAANLDWHQQKTNYTHTALMQLSYHFYIRISLYWAVAYLALNLAGLLGRASPSAKKTPKQTSTAPSSQGGDQDKLLSTFADGGRQGSVKQLVVGTLAA